MRKKIKVKIANEMNQKSLNKQLFFEIYLISKYK